MSDFMETFLSPLVNISGGPMTIVIAESGGVAYQFGTGTATFEGPDGVIEDPKRYLLVWEKVDGEWKTLAGVFSSDQ